MTQTNPFETIEVTVDGAVTRWRACSRSQSPRFAASTTPYEIPGNE